MNKEKYYKFMFFGGANFNMGVVVIFAIVPLFVSGLLPFFGIENPPSLIFMHLFGCLLIGFAVGYLIVMNNLEKGKIIALCGAIARILAFTLIIIYTAIGHCNWILLLIASPDVIFAAMNIEFYLNYKN